MAKNSQGSWVGAQTQPQYATYQTAGTLRPAQATPGPASPQAAPLPAIDPLPPPTDFVLPPNWTPTSPWPGVETQPPLTTSEQPAGRAPLVEAVLAAVGGGGGGGGGARAPGVRLNKF